VLFVLEAVVVEAITVMVQVRVVVEVLDIKIIFQ
jgi:hypothetical protein